MNKKYYREFIRKLINQDPTEIAITRKTVTDDGFGGKIEEEVILEPQTVRIYNKKSQRETVSDAGVFYSRADVLKLLATYDADLKKDDTFIYNGYSLRIRHVEDYFSICQQAELEVIG